MVLPNVDVIRYTTTLSTNMYVHGWDREILKANGPCMRRSHVKRLRGRRRWEIREQDWKCVNWIQLIWDSAHRRNSYWLNLQAPLPHAGLSVWYRRWSKPYAVIEQHLRELTYTSNLTKGLSRRANINVLLTLKINCRSPQTNWDEPGGTRSAHSKQQKFV